MHRTRGVMAALALGLAVSACHPAFVVTKFPTNEALYSASFAQFQKHRWDNAITGFDKLTLDLGIRDTLLVRSYWYLGEAHEHNGDYLLAAQAFSRLTESFTDDTLAPHAALAAGRDYERLWRRPDLDPTYGLTAMQTYTMVVQLFAQSNPAVADSARNGITKLNEWFAEKDYTTGMFFFRNKAWDSAILYFKGVVDKWPATDHARLSMVKLAEAYRKIHYSEDLAEICAQMRHLYSGNGDVRKACKGVGTPAASPAAADSGGVMLPQTPPA